MAPVAPGDRGRQRRRMDAIQFILSAPWATRPSIDSKLAIERHHARPIPLPNGSPILVHALEARFRDLDPPLSPQPACDACPATASILPIETEGGQHHAPSDTGETAGRRWSLARPGRQSRLLSSFGARKGGAPQIADAGLPGGATGCVRHAVDMGRRSADTRSVERPRIGECRALARTFNSYVSRDRSGRDAGARSAGRCSGSGPG